MSCTKPGKSHGRSQLTELWDCGLSGQIMRSPRPLAVPITVPGVNEKPRHGTKARTSLCFSPGGWLSRQASPNPNTQPGGSHAGPMWRSSPDTVVIGLRIPLVGALQHCGSIALGAKPYQTVIPMQNDAQCLELCACGLRPIDQIS